MNTYFFKCGQIEAISRPEMLEAVTASYMIIFLSKKNYFKSYSEFFSILAGSVFPGAISATTEAVPHIQTISLHLKTSHMSGTHGGVLRLDPLHENIRLILELNIKDKSSSM